MQLSNKPRGAVPKSTAPRGLLGMTDDQYSSSSATSAARSRSSGFSSIVVR